jgi:hypothetical protein
MTEEEFRDQLKCENEQIDQMAKRISQLVEAIIKHKAEVNEACAREGVTPSDASIRLWSVLSQPETYERPVDAMGAIGNTLERSWRPQPDCTLHDVVHVLMGIDDKLGLLLAQGRAG